LPAWNKAVARKMAAGVVLLLAGTAFIGLGAAWVLVRRLSGLALDFEEIQDLAPLAIGIAGFAALSLGLFRISSSMQVIWISESERPEIGEAVCWWIAGGWRN
jgi:hypothetical protein